jgi:hypothetical protein
MSKLRTVVLLAAVMALWTGTARAAPIVYNGTAVGGPTWNRPLEDLSALSGVGTNVPYDVFAFTADTTTTVNIRSAPTAPEYDNFLFLYQGSFNPATPLLNAVIANDDVNGMGVDAAFTAQLTAGTLYLVVTTGFDNGDAGRFQNTITPRAGSVHDSAVLPEPGSLNDLAVVPEPASLSLLGLGLATMGARRRRQRKAS